MTPNIIPCIFFGRKLAIGNINKLAFLASGPNMNIQFPCFAFGNHGVFRADDLFHLLNIQHNIWIDKV